MGDLSICLCGMFSSLYRFDERGSMSDALIIYLIAQSMIAALQIVIMLGSSGFRNLTFFGTAIVHALTACSVCITLLLILT